MAKKVKYAIDLKTVFNRSYSKANKDSVRPLISDPTIKRAYGLAVIDEIAKRTEKKKIDKHNKTLGTYSKAYAESLEGQIFGKKAGAKVNLHATGEMLASMVPIPSRATTLVIEFADQFNNDKAHGHINGYKNRNKKLERDFFGLPKKEEDRILNQIINQNASTISLLGEIDTLVNIGATLDDTATQLEIDLADVIGPDVLGDNFG